MQTPNELWLAASADKPLDLLRRAALVLFASLFAGLLIPGVAASYGGVLYNRDVEAKLQHIPALHEPATDLRKFKRESNSLQEAIARTDTYLLRVQPGTEEPARILSAIQLRHALSTRLAGKRAPVAASGFYLSNTMLLWPAMFTCLGWLVFVFPPGSHRIRNRVTPARFILLTAAILVFYRWPIWARNFVFYREGRVYYGNANFDVDQLGFFVQEGMGVGITFLLAILWSQWICFFEKRRAELSTPMSDAVREALDPHGIDRLSSTFLHWQVCSVVLALGFLWYTYFFWDIVLRTGDMRYTVNALTIHVLWLASWTLISAPLLLTWYSWQRTKAEAVSAVIARQSESGFNAEITLAAIRETQPIGAWNLAASSIGVAISFAVPILQAMLK